MVGWLGSLFFCLLLNSLLLLVCVALLIDALLPVGPCCRHFGNQANKIKFVGRLGCVHTACLPALDLFPSLPSGDHVGIGVGVGIGIACSLARTVSVSATCVALPVHQGPTLSPARAVSLFPSWPPIPRSSQLSFAGETRSWSSLWNCSCPLP